MPFVTSVEHRRHPRLKHRAKIRIILPNRSEELIVEMRDFSQSGLSLLAGAQLVAPIGAIVEVQTTEFDDAPIQRARVVRIEDGVGFAVEFVDE